MEVDTSQLKLGFQKTYGLLKSLATASEVINVFKIFMAFNYTVLLKAPP